MLGSCMTRWRDAISASIALRHTLLGAFLIAPWPHCDTSITLTEAQSAGRGWHDPHNMSHEPRRGKREEMARVGRAARDGRGLRPGRGRVSAEGLQYHARDAQNIPWRGRGAGAYGARGVEQVAY